ncbi:MAG: hypothetical protein ABSF16_14970 [Terracidiphilus sp.]|jgi:hypothetical protein
MRWLLSNYVAFVLVVIPVAAQKPVIFDVSNVVIGAQRIPTLYLYAEGKWSDAGDHIGSLSTQIQCYKALGFCDVATAFTFGVEANVSLDSFDILRWDGREIIAVDSSPPCIVRTLRADLVAKSITLSSTYKGSREKPACKDKDWPDSTAVLWGEEDIFKDAINKAKTKQ